MPGCSCRHVDRITLSDLVALLIARGHSNLPYPFATDPSRRTRADSGKEVVTPEGVREIQRWIDTYVEADVWVTGRTHHSISGTSGRRILAHRAGEIGYLATQNGDDSIDVFRLDAHDLGQAVAHELLLSRPGPHARIVVPRYIDYFEESATRDVEDSDDIDFGVSVSEPAITRTPDYTTIDDHDVTAVTTIQSSWRPARAWGLDWSRPALVCLTVDGADGPGDYIYTPDFSHATPTTHQLLTERIDKLIANDITALRQHRSVH